MSRDKIVVQSGFKFTIFSTSLKYKILRKLDTLGTYRKKSLPEIEMEKRKCTF